MILDDAMLRAYGLDNPRVVSALRAENQPVSRTRLNGRPCSNARHQALADRAVNWPSGSGTLNTDDRHRQSEAMRRLEGMDFSYQGRHNRRQQAPQWDDLTELDAAALA
jgi:hypothetical protein